MANKTLTGKETVTSLDAGDKVFVNAGNKVRQISLNDLNISLGVLNEAELAQVGFYTDFNETGSVILEQGGNLALADYIFSRGGNYLMKNDGTAAKLNPSDPTKFADGTPATLDGSKGQEMTMLPDFYYLVTTNKNGKPRFWISMKDIGGHYQPAQWIGTHKGYVSGGALMSRSGVVPTGNMTITQFWNAAQING
ncbi:MAG: hypothetical protein WCS17_05220, partial [Prevotella sp.]